MGRTTNVAIGATMLALGWLGIFGLQFGWVANLFFVIFVPWATLAWHPSQTAFVLAAVGIGLSTLDAFLWFSVPTDSGSSLRIWYYGPGYYVWLAAMSGSAIWLLVRAVPTETEQEISS